MQHEWNKNFDDGSKNQIFYCCNRSCRKNAEEKVKKVETRVMIVQNSASSKYDFTLGLVFNIN